MLHVRKKGPYKLEYRVLFIYEYKELRDFKI